jgi:hypothetical protein
MSTPHSTLTGADLHEPKGVAAATAGDVYIADGAGSGSWGVETPEGTDIVSTGAGNRATLTADGAGGAAWVDNMHGWGYYLDNATAQTFTTTPAILSINGSGAATELSYMPTGVSNFWDTTGDHIIADTLGDSYILRLDLPITNVTGAASILEMELDISGAASPTTVIVTRQISIAAGSNKTVSVSFGLFSLSTFIANGAQIFLSTDANTADVTAPAILIQRVSKGS